MTVQPTLDQFTVLARNDRFTAHLVGVVMGVSDREAAWLLMTWVGQGLVRLVDQPKHNTRGRRIPAVYEWVDE